YIFNLVAIGYFQSVEKVLPSIAFALLRGVVFLVPAFILMPMVFGDNGIWLALAVSETMTSFSIIAFYLYHRYRD
ncbi:MAG: MATE family efflux transporter, partial [Duncaniella sp.]|nr:MATE family efflux transporter [Duncaniella sp.]